MVSLISERICAQADTGPVMGRWNLLLERRFPLRSIKGSNNVSFKALGKRVAADQLIMCVLLTFHSFFAHCSP